MAETEQIFLFRIGWLTSLFIQKVTSPIEERWMMGKPDDNNSGLYWTVHSLLFRIPRCSYTEASPMPRRWPVYFALFCLHSALVNKANNITTSFYFTLSSLERESTLLLQNKDLESDRLGSNPSLWELQAVWPWVSYLTALGLCISVCRNANCNIISLTRSLWGLILYIENGFWYIISAQCLTLLLLHRWPNVLPLQIFF